MVTQKDRQYRFSLPRLHMVSNSPGHRYPANELPGLVREITSRLPAVVQLREKHLAAKSIYNLALAVKESLADSRSLLIINERFDIALSAGADGTHFPGNSCPLEKARNVTGSLVMGKSVHSLQDALTAESEGADYLVAGPVYETPLKRQYGPPLGPELLETICSNVSVPVYAIGGITPKNARQCLEQGAHGIAALSIFRSEANLCDTLESFNRVLKQCS